MGMEVNRTTRVGKIKYTNAWPVFHYFHPEKLQNSIELVTEVPSILNRRMLDGSLEVSAMSSFAYAEGADHFMLLPDLSVSTDGPVQSILLFSHKPLEEAVNGTIALTNTSATSVNLLKILVEKHLKGNPEYFTSEPDLEEMMNRADAGLLIGDHAIKASWENRGYYVTDLGQLWKEWTGCSMTFAVWAVRRSAVASRPKAISEIVQAFRSSKERSRSNLTPIINNAVREIGGTEHYWHRYFSNLCYDFGRREQQGLELYFKYAHELGLLKHEIKLQIWSDNTLTRVKE
ncbi:menaquinone biosynthesis protein [Paenibacillus sp. P96]|uniref:Chorismate dehydratase n=1 Tax=Paenibacillus zeirhizosphaerae TaxID=2987519 RepID=A0ABT9FPK7_9BACL|nr:menaquinone biosynthesis protein [Paenibacillus sp. P96]MDP4096649.1 menaquinone biosynthesis protein [Paenibacillus sp. P96]